MSSSYRFNFLVFFSCLISFQSFGIAPPWNWAHNAGGHSHDWFGAMACDPSGNTYVTGGFGALSCNFGPFTLSNAGSADICVAKYDAAGNVIWAKRAGSGYYEDGHAITVDAAGNVYVGGYFRSDTLFFASDTLINTSYHDEEIFIFKYDASGNELWAKRFGNTYHDKLTAMTIDGSGNLIVAGQFMAASITLGSFTLINPYQFYLEMFLAKLDPNGNVIWATCPNGTSGVGACSISMDPAGNIAVIGNFHTTQLILGPDTLYTAGGNDIFVAKYDSNGNALWGRRAGSNQWDNANGGCTDVLGNVYVAGNFSSLALVFGTDTLRNTVLGNYNSFIAKYDAVGNVLWARSADGSNTQNSGNTVATDAALNVYVGGNFYTPFVIFGTDTLLNDNLNHYNDAYLVKYDASGNEQWAKAVGGNDNDEIYSVVTDAPGNVYVAGLMGSNIMMFDAFTLQNTSTPGDSLDIFVARISDFTVGEQIAAAKDEISIYPNPAQEMVQLTLPVNDKSCFLSVYNAMGEIVFQEKIKSSRGNYFLNVESLTDGVYFIKLQWEDKNSTAKMIVQH
jgi:hypothetical protein